MPLRIVILSSRGQFTLRTPERDYLGVTPRQKVELTVQHGRLLIRRHRHSITTQTAGSLVRYARRVREEAARR